MNLLEQARYVYLALRTIPLDYAFALMEAGYIVDDLEAQWDREIVEGGYEWQ